MSIEWEIHQKLLEEQSPKAVGEFLVERWESAKVSLEEKESIAAYLIHIGAFGSLGKLFESAFEKHSEIPWSAFWEFCKECGIICDDKIVKAAYEGAQLHEQVTRVLRSRAFDAIVPSLQQDREKVLQQKRQTLDTRRKALLEKIEFLRLERMLDEEGRALDELIDSFPDEDFSDLKRDYDERLAIATLERKSHAVPRENPIMPQPDPELDKAAEWMSSEVVKVAQTSPHLLGDLALLLYFMEIYQPAIDLLEKAPPNRAADWLQLEMLIKARLFVRALELSKTYEERYSDVPSTAFAAVYARAQALHGLGEVEDAIQLLQSIVRIRPKYRAAQLLLDEWSGGLN